jgi:hypothetical protein
MECISDFSHTGRVLAFHCHPWSDAHTFYRVHFCKCFSRFQPSYSDVTCSTAHWYVQPKLSISRFTNRSTLVFDEMKFALNALPETFINMLQASRSSSDASFILNFCCQGFVSLRRIENYLHGAEVAPVASLDEQISTIAMQSATITWPRDRLRSSSAGPSTAATPKNKFVLMDMSMVFPTGELSLICGKLGSGKTLLLLCA